MAGFRTLMAVTALTALPVSIAVTPNAPAALDVFFAIVYGVAALVGLGWIARELVRDWLFWRTPSRPPDITPDRSATRDHEEAA